MRIAACAAAPAMALEPARRSIVFGGTDETHDSFYGAWLELIYREAWRRLGYDFEYKGFPSKRATALATEGLIDGEIHRVADFNKENPSLVRVEESHFSTNFAVYAMREIPLANGSKGLAGLHYRIEYRAGVLYAERFLNAHVERRFVSSVPNALQGLRKLVAGRTDLYMDQGVTVEALLATAEFRHSGIRSVATLDEQPCHAFLAAKNAKLAAPLASTLAAMKKEGLIEKYRTQALAKRLPH